MRARAPIAAAIVGLLVAACGGGSSSGSASGGSGGPSDGGTATDAGQGSGSDAGSGSDGGQDAGSGGGGQDGGQDGGTASSDCDALVPQAPGAPIEFRWTDRDLNSNSGGRCDRAETDGTGHVALFWRHSFQPGDHRFAFLDPATGKQVGSYGGIGLTLIGQASGFIGGNCQGTNCAQNRVVVDPTGKELFASQFSPSGNGMPANDPTGGMIQVRFSAPSGTATTITLDAIDPSGAVRWSQSLPDGFADTGPRSVITGVDRKGNVLALWISTQRYGAGTWAGQWFDHAGSPGPVFQAATPGVFPSQLFERVGDGLFLAGSLSTGVGPAWLGQFDAQATTMSPPPPWLAARPGKTLHMIRGGTGYAVLPVPGSSAGCEQQIEVVSPSGQVCGSATFSIGGGACATGTIIVGYDGTVVQQGPRERETCTAVDHICTCTYRYWPAFFR
jgi:hypothetical protein